MHTYGTVIGTLITHIQENGHTAWKTYLAELKCTVQTAKY